MINIKFLLGLYSSTEKIEAKENSLLKEFNELETYKQSEELATFQQLKKEVESSDFIQKKAALKSLNYKKSEYFKKEKEYESLKKSKRIINYYNVLNSSSYKNFTEVKDSELLKEYEQLSKEVQSEKFKNKHAELKSLIFKNSEEFNKEIEFKKLNNSKEIKNYYKVLSSESYKLFSLMHDSQDVKHFLELEKFAKEHPEAIKQKKADDINADVLERINEYNTLKKDKRFGDYFKFEASNEFKLFQETINSGLIKKFEDIKSYIESPEFKSQKSYLMLPFVKKWEVTEEYNHEQAYKQISDKPEIKEYFKFINSESFKLFQEVSNSGEIKHYEELEAYINGDEFKAQKEYLLLKFEDKWSKTEESKHEITYNTILKSDTYKWYLKVVNSNKFDELKKWMVSFEDDFNEAKLSDKWLTKFYWGENFLHEGYSLSDDLHLFTDGDNLKISNSILSIETRKEKVIGKAWNPMFGFMPREFEFSSGIINTGKSFRQKYGKFKAKIKMNATEDVSSTFWLATEQMIPHIDIAKFHKNKYYLANFWRSATNEIQKSISSLWASKLSKGFFIFELEWAPGKLIWRINNIEIKSTEQGVPDEEMYLQIAAGIQAATSNQYPSILEIDWVKCYQKNDIV